MTRKPLKLPTAAVLKLAKDAAERLGSLSKDPQVRQEALNVTDALQRLLRAVREAKPR
ncbi:hypothetical protein [Deinococcus irradiatisoli]|uniref:hypothetical protein n=1 Tax=Deinococcus irradiatisoli TaxID=2202254 RepID=UPI0015E838C0|nr:hypothetical protein [Deinococcus irradiatisoli]